jgi:MYXO-CTERM domain-containing protein
MTIKSLVLGLAVAASLGSTAIAGNLVLNGNLALNGCSGSPSLGTNCVYINAPHTGQITDWTVGGAGSSSSWNAVYIYDPAPGTDLPAYMPAQYDICSPAGGFVPGNSCADPDGAGWFINEDGDPAFPASISQTIPVGTNPLVDLVLGQEYALTFSWAAVQRNDESGPTTESLGVSLGTSLVTPASPSPINLPSGGFSGWFTTTFAFTYTGLGTAPNVLTFLASGTPTGLPPSINLGSISLTAVPEPSSWEMLIAGFGFLALVGVVARRRRQMAASE